MPKVATLAADPSAAALMFPFITRSHPDADVTAIDLGPNLAGRGSFWLAPWLMQQQGVIKATNCEISGDVNCGKSSLAKSMGLEFAGLQGAPLDGHPQYMTVRYNDRREEGKKGEYSSTVESVHGLVVPLRNYRINPFDPGVIQATEVDMIETAVSLAEIAKTSGLVGYEGFVQQVAINQMLRQGVRDPHVLEQKLRTLNTQGIKDYYAESDSQLLADLKEKYADRPELVAQLGIEMEQPAFIDEYEIQKAAAYMATLWRDIVGPKFGYAFGGNTPLDSVFINRIASYDASGMLPHVETAMNTLFMQYESIGIREQDLRIIPDVSFTDETGVKMENVAFARAREHRARMARRSKEAAFTMTQYVTDTVNAGEPGSPLRRHAEAIDKAIGFRIIGRQLNRPDIVQRLRELEFSKPDIEFITTDMENYCFAFKANGWPPVFFRRHIGKDMKKLVETNTASASMTQPIPLSSDPAAAARIERIRQAELSNS